MPIVLPILMTGCSCTGIILEGYNAVDTMVYGYRSAIVTDVRTRAGAPTTMLRHNPISTNSDFWFLQTFVSPYVPLNPRTIDPNRPSNTVNLI